MKEIKYANKINRYKYSFWHRTKLPNFCYSYDVDCVEYRAKRGIVAVFGLTELKTFENLSYTKKIIFERTKLEREILTTIANALKIKAYYVFYNKMLSRFLVIDLLSSEERFMDPSEYAEFIKNL